MSDDPSVLALVIRRIGALRTRYSAYMGVRGARQGRIAVTLLVAMVSLASCSPKSAERRPTPFVSDNARAGGAVIVPALVDQPLVLAEKELRDLGLRVDISEPRVVNKCPAGPRCVSGATLFVSAQYPYAGARVDRNAVVFLEVAKFIEESD